MAAGSIEVVTFLEAVLGLESEVVSCLQRYRVSRDDCLVCEWRSQMEVVYGFPALLFAQAGQATIAAP